VSAENTVKGIAVTGVIGEDVHVVGIRVIENALRDSGFKVHSLGAQVSQEEFIQAALETNADAILVSSLSGHAEILVHTFREKCVEAGLGNVILYIGGNLVLSEAQMANAENIFKDLGFDRVYLPGTTPYKVIEDLTADLAQAGRKQ
jgi:methylaspartate mutase sigma subunit